MEQVKSGEVSEEIGRAAEKAIGEFYLFIYLNEVNREEQNRNAQNPKR